MKKEEAKRIHEQYKMDILRHPVTQEAWALYLEANSEIPELTEICNSDTWPVVGTIEYCDTKTIYKLICPTKWFDLWGWKD